MYADDLVAVGYCYLLGLATDAEVRTGLSDLADATLAAGLVAARRLVAAELDIGEPADGGPGPATGWACGSR